MYDFKKSLKLPKSVYLLILSVTFLITDSGNNIQLKIIWLLLSCIVSYIISNLLKEKQPQQPSVQMLFKGYDINEQRSNDESLHSNEPIFEIREINHLLWKKVSLFNCESNITEAKIIKSDISGITF